MSLSHRSVLPPRVGDCHQFRRGLKSVRDDDIPSSSLAVFAVRGVTCDVEVHLPSSLRMYPMDIFGVKSILQLLEPDPSYSFWSQIHPTAFEARSILQLLEPDPYPTVSVARSILKTSPDCQQCSLYLQMRTLYFPVTINMRSNLGGG